MQRRDCWAAGVVEVIEVQAAPLTCRGRDELRVNAAIYRIDENAGGEKSRYRPNSTDRLTGVPFASVGDSTCSVSFTSESPSPLRVHQPVPRPTNGRGALRTW